MYRAARAARATVGQPSAVSSPSSTPSQVPRNHRPEETAVADQDERPDRQPAPPLRPVQDRQEPLRALEVPHEQERGETDAGERDERGGQADELARGGKPSEAARNTRPNAPAPIPFVHR